MVIVRKYTEVDLGSGYLKFAPKEDHLVELTIEKDGNKIIFPAFCGDDIDNLEWLLAEMRKHTDE